MNYKSQIDIISNAIISSKNDPHKIKEILKGDSLENLKIYRKNYFYLTLNTLKSDFPALYKYIGENNFKYFTQAFLNINGINSPCIFDISFEFQTFLNKNYNQHQDDLIEDLAKIDLMWSQGLIQRITVSLGMLEFWQELMTNTSNNKSINLDKKIILSLGFEGEEQVIKQLNFQTK